MNVISTNSLEVVFNDELERLVIICRQPFNSEEFKEGSMGALQFAKEYHVKQWLLDCREIGELSEEDHTWIQAQLFPLIMMSLGENNYIAIVLSDKCYLKLLNKVGKLGLKSYNSYIKINTFCGLAEASNWLNEHIQHTGK